MTNYSDLLSSFEKEGRLRKFPSDFHKLVMDGEYIDLSSNDYLGLDFDSEELQRKYHLIFTDVSMSSNASRLLSGKQSEFIQLEKILENLYNKEVLLFNSGYHANVGLVQALSIEGTLWVSDKLIHASAIDGIRLSGAPCKRFRHNDTTHLEKIIEKEHSNYDRIIVLCESVYSMDGDIAPIEDIIKIKKRYPKVMIYLDEAHAFGVFGKKGLGVAEEKGVIQDIDFLVGTFGKACNSIGAFVATSGEMKEYFINTARSLIFSTALPPANIAWTTFMISTLQKLQHRREYLGEISLKFKNAIEEITGEKCLSESQIVPLITRDSNLAVSMSQELFRRGIIALPIRRPTVAAGGERIRFSLHAKIKRLQFEQMVSDIASVYSMFKSH